MVLALFASESRAQLLAQWLFDGSTTSASSVDPNATTGSAAMVGIGNSGGCSGFFHVGATPGCGSSNCATSLGYGGNNWPTGSVTSSTDYIEVSIAPVASYEMTLTSFQFDERRSGTGPRNWEVRSSLDGYTSTLGSGSIPDNTTWRCDHSVSLGVAFQDLTGSVTFRVYGYNAEGSLGTHRFDELQVFGTITTVLPVQWIDFDAVTSDDAVQLTWSTASELDNALFSIERSFDALTFDEVGLVAGLGSGARINEYRFIDKQPMAGTSYYRLRQEDFSGESSYSQIRKVQFDNDKPYFVIAPNPVQDQLQVRIAAPFEEAALIEIVDLTGRLIESHNLELVDGGAVLDYPANNLSAGQYFVSVTTTSRQTTLPLIKR